MIEIPYDRLLGEVQRNHRNFSTLTLFDAKSIGLLRIPDRQRILGSVANCEAEEDPEEVVDEVGS